MYQKLTSYFYSNVVGHYVSEQFEKLTGLTISYLLDCNIPEEEIVEIMLSYKIDVMTPQNLPDSLWIVNPQIYTYKRTNEERIKQDNLIKRNEFYYHPRLMIRSPMPTIVNGREIIGNYYCEPICRFTISDLIDYFCLKADINIDYVNANYSISNVQYLLSLCKKVSVVFEPIDIILFTIDYTVDYAEHYLSNFTQLQQNLGIVVEGLKNKASWARAYGHNKIVWRTEQCLSLK